AAGYCRQEYGEQDFKRRGTGEFSDFNGVLGFNVVFDEAPEVGLQGMRSASSVASHRASRSRVTFVNWLFLYLRLEE
ncbi:hypothetical protein, partial [Microbulbifer harenosus]|uniref:hypothetical protein n=1 Tax=Microbulbifer harenosus TaxID=2576840 RepID=UPI001484EA41